MEVFILISKAICNHESESCSSAFWKLYKLQGECEEELPTFCVRLSKAQDVQGDALVP